MSPLTLRLSEVTMDQEFVSYLRKEVRKRGLGVLLAIFAIVMLLMIYQIVTHDDPKQSLEITHLLLLMSAALVSLSITFLMSKFDEKYAELLGPSLGFSLVICIGLVDLIGIFEVTPVMRNNQVYLTFLTYLISTGLFNVSFVQHIIIRSFWYLTSMVIIIVKRF